ncbi:MAG: HAD family hydrolase [Solirubrobacteraceae bacterium]|nr:HAD family hydrolase [Patulibacter sp.]
MAEPRPAQADERPVAVFDMDGVLVHGDVFGSFVRQHLRGSAPHLLAAGAVLPWLTAPMVLRPTRRVALKAFLDLALAGVTDEVYATEASRYGAELGVHPTRVVTQAVAEARRLVDEAGHRLVIATACETRLARAYVDAIGLVDAEVYGTPITFRRTGPMQVAFHNHGAQKVRTLAAAGIAAPWAVAYTDALSDVPLLRGARRAVLVNPDEWLRSRVERQLGHAADEVSWPEVRLPRADRPRVG